MNTLEFRIQFLPLFMFSFLFHFSNLLLKPKHAVWIVHSWTVLWPSAIHAYILVRFKWSDNIYLSVYIGSCKLQSNSYHIHLWFIALKYRSSNPVLQLITYSCIYLLFCEIELDTSLTNVTNTNTRYNHYIN